MLEPESAGAKALERPGQIQIRSEVLWPVGWAAVVAICAAYVFFFATLRALPLQDFPNHWARAVVMADLLFDHGARYGSIYTLALSPSPYVLHDLVLTSFIGLFGAQAGGAVFVVLVLLSMPLALMFYMRAARLSPRNGQLVFLIALYLGTDFFFLMAFTAFRLALAIVIVCLGLVEMLRRQWSLGLFFAYTSVLVIGYLTHLTAPVFFAVVLGVSSTLRLWQRSSSLRLELFLWLPLAALWVIHAGLAPPPHSATYGYSWGTWHQKLQHLSLEFGRYGSHFDEPMSILLLACLLWPLRRCLRPYRLAKPEVLEALAIAAGFIAVYLVLPQETADSAFVDVRALPMIVLMFLLACLNIPERGSTGRIFNTWLPLGLAALLAVGNLAYLVRHVSKNEALLSQYRQLGMAVPAGSYILPIYTIPKDGELRPLLHASAYLIADRGAVTPYLFSGDRGDSMTYFRYRERPYWPDEDWYRTQQNWNRATEQMYEVGGRAYTWRFTHAKRDEEWKPATFVPIDWNRVTCRYDFLLLTLPVDMSLIGIPTRPVSTNAVATLLAVDKSACRPNLNSKRIVRLESEH